MNLVISSEMIPVSNSLELVQWRSIYALSKVTGSTPDLVNFSFGWLLVVGVKADYLTRDLGL